jgi:uncharacterized protein
MPTPTDNVALLKTAYSEWAGKKGADLDCWLNIVDDGAYAMSLAKGAPEMTFTRERSSKDEIRGYLQELTRDWEMITYDMDDFIAQDDRVVVIGNVAWRNKATGKVAETPKVDIWRFRDGKVVEFAEFYDTARSFAAAVP